MNASDFRPMDLDMRQARVFQLTLDWLKRGGDDACSFDMRYWAEPPALGDCGTICCIGGYIEEVAAPAVYGANAPNLRKIPGLDYLLFLLYHSYEAFGDTQNTTIAIRRINAMLATGQTAVDWKELETQENWIAENESRIVKSWENASAPQG